MNILFSGDWHCSLSDLDRCQIVVNQVIEILVRQKPPRYFVHLGDIKTQFNPVDQRVSNFIVKSLLRIRENCEGMYFVRGNHDSIATQDDVPSCVPLLEAAKVDVVADGEWQSSILGDGDVGLWLVPYFRDPQRQREEMAAARRDAAHFKGTRILAFHNEVEGCEVSAYRKGTGLTVNHLGAHNVFDLCVGGHIHKPQHIKPNVYYCGSPFAVDWSEINITHRFLVLEI